jgi:hypothetical protein
MVTTSKAAQTMANAKRTKYSRRRAGAIPPAAGDSTVVTMILSKLWCTGGRRGSA